MTKLTVHLPWPPSLNRIWRSKTNAKTGKPLVYLDPKYRDWKREADGMAMQQRVKGYIGGHFKAFITLNENRRRANTDCDNRAKVLLDWMQRAGFIKNDSLADAVDITWGPAVSGCTVTVFANPAPSNPSVSL